MPSWVRRICRDHPYLGLPLSLSSGRVTLGDLGDWVLHAWLRERTGGHSLWSPSAVTGSCLECVLLLGHEGPEDAVGPGARSTFPTVSRYRPGCCLEEEGPSPVYCAHGHGVLGFWGTQK